MSWIEEADQPDLPDIFRALSINFQALDIVRELNEGLGFGNSTLSRVQEEAIATVVSVANRCRYGALTHGGFLRRYSGDSELASQILNDYTKADFSAKNRIMLDFAVRITLKPAELTENEIDRLRAAGFEDKDIVSVVLLACLVNFMNRVASSLGVEVPNGFQRSVEGWLTGLARQQNWLLHTGMVEPQLQPESSAVAGSISIASERPPVAEDRHKVCARNEVSPANHKVQMTEPQEEISTCTDASTHLSGRNNSELNQPLQQFVDECCVISPGEAATARDLYIGYVRWCDESHWRPLLQRNFGLKLSGLGFHRRRRGHGRHWWLGIGMRPWR